MNKKYDITVVKTAFDVAGYTLVTQHYKNPHQPLEYVCPAGHAGKTSWLRFKTGNRCPVCAGNAKISHAEALAFFHQNGCELLEEFLGTQHPVRYRCSCGNESQIRWYDFKAGKRCKKCQPARQSGENNGRWNPDREAVVLRKKMCNAAHTALKTTMKAIGKKKETRTFALLGYGSQELKQAMERHPDWSKVKTGKWSIDHIFPIKAFLDFSITDIRLINSLENLRPVLLRENQRKSGKYCKDDFKLWLLKKGVIS